MSTNANEVTTSGTAFDEDVLTIATEIWSELEASSAFEPNWMVKLFYNDMIEKEDKTDFNRPLEMMTAEYLSVTPKLNWNATVKSTVCFLSLLILSTSFVCATHWFSQHASQKFLERILMTRLLLDVKQDP